ncbi:MAG: AAA family ATPase [Puniceicoccaceae bacterium]
MSRFLDDIEPEQPKQKVGDPWNGLPPPRQWNDIEADLDAGKIKPPEEIIKGLLFRGGKMLLPAPSKARKTWMLLHLAACVCSGQPWLGFETKRCPVLYLDLELLLHEAPAREKLIKEAAKFWNLSDLHIQQLRGHKLNMDRIKEALIAYCREHGIGLLIIDPWYKLSGGADEIGTEGVADLMAELEEIAREANCAVAISHHFTKGDSSQKSVIDLASGSGVFGRDPDLICGMRELADSTEEEPLVKMEFVARSFKPVRPIGLRWKFPLWVRDDRLDLKLKIPGSVGRPKENHVEDIMEVLGDMELAVSDWQDLCHAKKGTPARTFRDLKATAKIEGRFTERKEGRTVYCKATVAETLPPISATIKSHQMGLSEQ